AAAGREPGNTPADQLGVPRSSRAILALLLLPFLAGACLLSLLFLQLGVKNVPGPAFLSQSGVLWFVLVGCGILAVLGMRRLGRGHRIPSPATGPGRPRWHKIWVSALLVALIAIPTRLFLLGAYIVPV